MYIRGVDAGPIPWPSCPACRGLDWHRDGYRTQRAEDGTIEHGRVTPSAQRQGSMVVCAMRFRGPDDGILHARLNRALSLGID